ncbi:MAG: hypothetical protein KGH98_01155 [Candidatus Micrarchaeota archaeon]|nr:hypothetical protein [Candidatus Micrarchaeota archaeon]
MIKKIVLIGLLVFVIGLVVMFSLSATQNISGLTQTQPIAKNVTIGASSFYSLPLYISNYSLMLVIGNFSAPVNLYLFNGSALSRWSGRASNSSSGLSDAKSLEGAGAELVISNASGFYLPAMQFTSNSTRVAYSALAPGKGIQPGTYYLVADNTNGSVSSKSSISGQLAYLPEVPNETTPANLGALGNQIAIGAVGFIIVLAGIVIIVIGLMKAPKVPGRTDKDTPADEEVERLYSGIEKPIKAKHKRHMTRKG